MPSGLALIPGQSSVQTVMASTVSSRQEGWSSGMPRISDVSREGPFDAYASPMDMEDSPLVMTGLPGRWAHVVEPSYSVAVCYVAA